MSTFLVVRGQTRRIPGFTIVELLVVIAIIGVLVGLLLPGLSAARDRARRTQNSSNLRSVGQAIINYEGVKKTFPPLIRIYNTERESEVGPRNQTFTTSWAFELLPYLDQQNLYDALEEEKPVTDQNTNAAGDPKPNPFTFPLEIYTNPRVRTATADCPFPMNPSYKGASLDYAVNGGCITPRSISDQTDEDLAPFAEIPAGSTPFLRRGVGPFQWKPGTSFAVAGAQVTDGLSNTIAAGDRYIFNGGALQPRYDDAGLVGASVNSIVRYAFFYPKDSPPPPQGQGLDSAASGELASPFPLHTGELSLLKFGTSRGSDACFVFLDGRMQWVSYDVDRLVFAHLCAIADGQPVRTTNLQ
jgi:prepilin-type N-terminal cleavage/methylation domain-containing protein